jgi:hypothetical protein
VAIFNAEVRSMVRSEGGRICCDFKELRRWTRSLRAFSCAKVPYRSTHVLSGGLSEETATSGGAIAAGHLLEILEGALHAYVLRTVLLGDLPLPD